MKNIIIYSLFLLASLCNIYGQNSGQNDTIADSFVSLAKEFKKNMKTDSALIYYEKASAEYQSNGSIEKFIDAYNQIGIILTRQDKYEEALTYLNKALSTGLSSLDSNNLTISTTYISLGVIYNAEENYSQSLSYHYKALSIRLLKLGKYHADVATSYGNIGNVCRNNQDFDKSIDAHLNAMKIRKKLFGVTSAEIVESYVGLGKANQEKKVYKNALKYFEKALNNKINQYGEGHKDLVRFYKYVGNLYFLMENKAKGDEYKKKWEEIEKK